MHSFYIFSNEGDSLRVSIEKKNDGILLNLGEFELEIDQESAMDIADSLIDIASEISDDRD